MRRLVIDIEEEMHNDLEILAGGIRSLRDKIVLDLIQNELEKQKHVIARLKEVERKRQEHLEMLRDHYKESENSNNRNGENDGKNSLNRGQI